MLMCVTTCDGNFIVCWLILWLMVWQQMDSVILMDCKAALYSIYVSWRVSFQLKKRVFFASCKDLKGGWKSLQLKSILKLKSVSFCKDFKGGWKSLQLKSILKWKSASFCKDFKGGWKSLQISFEFGMFRFARILRQLENPYSWRVSYWSWRVFHFVRILKEVENPYRSVSVWYVSFCKDFKAAWKSLQLKSILKLKSIIAIGASNFEILLQICQKAHNFVFLNVLKSSFQL